MNKRINVMLPEQTLTVLDRIAKKGDRSRIISEAELHYVHNRAKQRLKEQLKAGYQANTQENIEIAMEWFPLEEEALNESRRRSVRGKK